MFCKGELDTFCFSSLTGSPLIFRFSKEKSAFNEEFSLSPVFEFLVLLRDFEEF